MLEYTWESKLAVQGYQAVCGVDEAGRGPLCGPVVAAAVILPQGLYLEGLNDSKKLTEKKREALYDEIVTADSWGSCERSGASLTMLFNRLRARLPCHCTLPMLTAPLSSLLMLP